MTCVPCPCAPRRGTARRGPTGSASRYVLGSKPWFRDEHVDVVHVEEDAAVGRLRPRRARNSHSLIVEPANSTYVDGFSSAMGAPRMSCTARTRLHDVAERLLGVRHGQKVVRVLPGDARPAEVIGDPARPRARRAAPAARARYARSSGSVDPIESDTPCITIGYRSAIASRK